MNKYFVNAARPHAWSKTRLARLPDHYYRFRKSLELESSVGYDQKIDTKLLDYKITNTKTLKIERVAKPKIDVLYPKEADEGLWGGEGLVKGFTKPKRYLYVSLDLIYPRVFFPKLWRTIFYSEILDRYFKLIITPSVKDAIVEAKGFDNYILKTPVQDLKSKLAFSLRRKMLITLSKKNYYPNDKLKHKLIEQKYKDCIIPLEEAEWFGLPIEHALTKKFLQEVKEREYNPLKIEFAQELIKNLNELKKKEKFNKQGNEKSLKNKVLENVFPFFSKKT